MDGNAPVAASGAPALGPQTTQPPQQQPSHLQGQGQGQQQQQQQQPQQGQQQGQQQAQQQPPHPDLQKPPAAPGEARPAPVWVPPDEFASTQRELAELRRFRETVEQERTTAEAERIKALASEETMRKEIDKLHGTYQANLTKERQEKLEVQQRWLNTTRDQTIASVLAGVRFAGQNPNETADLARRILESEVEAVLDAMGNPVVRDRQTHRPAIDYLRERLASPQFALFLEANNRGGTAGAGGGQYPANPQFHGNDNFGEWAKGFRDRRASARQGRNLPGGG